MKQKNRLSQRDKLFNPNYTFVGNPTPFLKGLPKRSRNLERFVDPDENIKFLNKKFIKDGYMYLLRGAKNGQETGFYSSMYKEGKTIESEQLNPASVAYAQSVNGNTPFISATTDIYVAYGFANKEKIYVLKVPVEDVYNFCTDEDPVLDLEEEEFMIPDYVSQEEIVRSFKYDKFKSIYNFLTNEIGLNIAPIDLGEFGDINKPDENRLEAIEYFNNSFDFLESPLTSVQNNMVNIQLTDEELKRATDLDIKNENRRFRKIAMFTDAHALLEPTKAILEDMKKRGITEIYSLGDNIGLGPNPVEVLDLLDEYNVTSIQGNYEDMINLGLEPFYSYLTYDKILHTKWMKSKLRSDQLERLKVFPHFINLAIANKNIALCHFANDVRCDFTYHNSWQYKVALDNNLMAYQQFLYTNSEEHLLEIAANLGLDADNLSQLSRDQILKAILFYVKLNKAKFEDCDNGFLSYVKEPLFIHGTKIHTVDEYDTVFQGHLHFAAKESMPNTDIYTLRAVGMGYKDDSEIDQAAYLILEECSDGINVKTVHVPYDRDKMCYSINHAELVNDDIKKYTLTK